MPTYNAVGVTAILSVASLQASLSTVLDLKQGKEQREDAQRIHHVFAQGTKLPERPIGADQSEQGVMQFLGEHGDMPFFMAEAGERVARRGNAGGAVLRKEGGLISSTPIEELGADSPLTSLAVTPSNDTPINSATGSPMPVTPDAKRTNMRVQTPKATADNGFSAEFTQARGYLDRPEGPQALRLGISIDNKAFLPKRGHSKLAGSDLKIEVFFNGQLASVTLLNRRAAAVEFVDNQLVFSGTRFHRQFEKPWVYDRINSEGLEDPNNGRYETAVKRWNGITAELQNEAAARGLNRLGDRAPSAEFLFALSQVKLPDRVKDMPSFGIIDVVISAGIGKKYGPESGYILMPTRLDDPTHTTGTSEDPFTDSVILPSTPPQQTSPTNRQSMQRATTSPKALSFEHQSDSAAMASPTPKRVIDLTAELELDMVNLRKPAQPYETAHGKTGTAGRSLRQRLGDLKKMSPPKREREMAALRQELDERKPRPMTRNKPTEDGIEASPLKKLRLDYPIDGNLEMPTEAALAEGDSPPKSTMDPVKSYRTGPPAYLLPDSADPDAMLTQERIDMALSAGADFSGPLVRRIVSSSPLSTPKRKTRASALAHSPCSEPVKAQRHMIKKTPTPDRNVLYDDYGAPIPIDPALTGSLSAKPKRSGRGVNRTRKSWMPGERTPLECLQAFEVPKLCVGSVLGYGEGETQRQVGKARGGEFREEQLVVGMRFVVV